MLLTWLSRIKWNIMMHRAVHCLIHNEKGPLHLLEHVSLKGKVLQRQFRPNKKESEVQ